MEIYQTEEQQVEAIKSYWQKNGNTIIAGIVLGFAGFIGVNLYKESKLDEELAVADSYQTLIESSVTDADGFTAKGEQFINENSDNSYASLTALALAKEAASKQDWALTQTQLETAIAKAPTEGIKAIASLRLARVQVQLEQYAEAIATLNNKLPESFTGAAEEIKGDAYLQQGKTDLARNAYQAAIAADGLSTSPNLQVKLDDLAQATVLPVSDAKVETEVTPEATSSEVK